ncbi:MAG TPA: secretin N-terminal domain-containing protein [Vicinamibacteria bacterium]|nr:secretin N-terminal domain-containing protein [Vicinamibacteria bacterium]
MRALAFAALAALAAAPVAAQPLNPRPAAKTEMRVYDLGLNDPAVATEIIRGLLSPEGRVYPDPAQHRLVVSDRPDVHARVAEAMKTLNVPPRNIRIEVSARMERTDRQRQLDASGTVAEGPVHASVGRRPPPQTGVVIGGQDSRSRTTVNARQQLLVLSGGRASLTVAEEVPYSEWLYTWGVGHGLWAQNVVWQQVGTSMVVEPRVLGNGTILVRLTPRFDYRAGGSSQTVDVTELSTEVIVRAGEEIALGGVPFRDTDFRERFLAGIDESGQTARVDMSLRATVE